MRLWWRECEVVVEGVWGCGGGSVRLCWRECEVVVVGV